jgi:hypothetical protein
MEAPAGCRGGARALVGSAVRPTGRAGVAEWTEDSFVGEDWYRASTRGAVDLTGAVINAEQAAQLARAPPPRSPLTGRNRPDGKASSPPSRRLETDIHRANVRHMLRFGRSLAAQKRLLPPSRRATSSRCHRSSVPGVTRKTGHRSRGSSRASTASTIRSDGVNRGRVTCRRSTITWWRSTAISTSFASGAGPSLARPSSRRTSTKPSVRTTTSGDHASRNAAGRNPLPEVAPFTPVRRRLPRRYSAPRGSCRSTRSLSPPQPELGRPYRHPPSHVPRRRCRPGSRRLNAGHHPASKQDTRQTHPGANPQTPVPMPPK